MPRRHRFVSSMAVNSAKPINLIKPIKCLALFLLFALGFSHNLHAQSAYLKPDDKIMWIGDSITAQGIYEHHVMGILKALYPDAHITDINLGVGGATAPSRFSNIPQSVDKEKPTIMTVMFGVNDTHWSLDRDAADSATKGEIYAKGLRQYIDLAKSKNTDLFLFRETHFSHNQSPLPYTNGVNAALMNLFSAETKLATETGTPIVDVYGNYTSELAKAWKADPKYEFTPNFVHPTTLAHVAVAGAILEAWGAGLPLAKGNERGDLHVVPSRPAIGIQASSAYGIVKPGKPVELKLIFFPFTNTTGNVQAVAMDEAHTFKVHFENINESGGLVPLTEEHIKIEPGRLTERWDIKPIYSVYSGKIADKPSFTTNTTPFYYSRLIPTEPAPFTHDEKGWVTWEGNPAPYVNLTDLKVHILAQSVHTEFTWKDTTPVPAKLEPYKARLGEPVTTPLDMSSPFGQPCDAVELFFDLRNAESAARYTSDMDSIPQGTARVGLYKISENGKIIAKLQVSPATLAPAFTLTELGDDRYTIDYTGPIPDAGVGFNMLVTDAKEYAPNKTRGEYLTSVQNVGMDWVGCFRLTQKQKGYFYRVGY